MFFSSLLYGLQARFRNFWQNMDAAPIGRMKIGRVVEKPIFFTASGRLVNLYKPVCSPFACSNLHTMCRNELLFHDLSPLSTIHKQQPCPLSYRQAACDQASDIL